MSVFNSANARVLVAHPDGHVRSLLRKGLEEKGFIVEPAAGIDEAAWLLGQSTFDAAIFAHKLDDVFAPGICQWIRGKKDGGHMGVILLTAEEDTVERIIGLEAGADDCVTRPANEDDVRDLTARLKQILWRRNLHRLESSGVVLDQLSRNVTRDGRPIDLTTGEFNLLAVLMTSPGREFSKDELARRLRGWSRMSVVRLRRKLDAGQEPGSRSLIRGVRKKGYMFDPAAPAG
jgi:DNA-binding response OmpR family regulator